MKAKHFRTAALGNKYNTSSLTRKEQTAYSYKSHGAESTPMVLSLFCVYIANTPSKITFLVRTLLLRRLLGIYYIDIQYYIIV